MPLVIFPRRLYMSDASSQDSLSNINTLRKLDTDTQGNLTFNGKTIAEKSIEVSYDLSVTKKLIKQKFIELPEDCDTSRTISLSLQGVMMQRGFDWNVIEHDWPDKDLISWDSLNLENTIQSGDKVSISYYKKV